MNTVGLHSKARGAFGRDETENGRNEPTSKTRMAEEVNVLGSADHLDMIPITTGLRVVQGLVAIVQSS